MRCVQHIQLLPEFANVFLCVCYFLLIRSEAPLLPQRLGDGGAVFLDDYISERWLPGPGGRHSQVVKLTRVIKKDVHNPKRTKKEF